MSGAIGSVMLVDSLDLSAERKGIMPSIDTYRVDGTAGNVGTPGAPILHFQLLVNESGGKVTGQAQITQAVAPPNNEFQIENLSGKVASLVFGGQISLVVTLRGTYGQPGPPPTDFIIEEKFEAHFQLDTQWDGRGSFEYGRHKISDVPVSSTKTGGGLVPLYGVVIHGAAATGDLARMKEIAAQADTYLAKTPEVQDALKALKAEIAKAGN
jgi:hypothetical protein